MKKVLVIFGGISSEHEISCVSAYNVIENLDKTKYVVNYLGIDKDGNWYKYTGNINNIKDNKWVSDTDNKLKVDEIFLELKKYDTVFPVLHGKMGEDGKIQGLFEVAGVNYVGCNVLGSSIGMNKVLSKKIAKSNGVPIVPYIEINKFEYMNYNEKDFENLVTKINSDIKFPLIIKPNQEGSSFGVEKVDCVDDLKKSIESSFNYDNKILIEKYISNRKEVECAVLEYKDKTIFVSTPGEIVSANEFYDYEAKYEKQESYTKIPADVSDEIIRKIKEYAKIIFKSLGLTCISRIDFFVDNDNIFFNEVNTMPGFTPISMYPKMLINDGIEYQKILDILIDNENKG